MNIEQQVASLELCKRLKELGISQNGYFSWLKFPDQKYRIIRNDQTNCAECSAFSVAELGELLPNYLENPDEDDQVVKFTCYKTDFGWNATYSYQYFSQSEKSEADSRAKCLIMLIEKGIISPS